MNEEIIEFVDADLPTEAKLLRIEKAIFKKALTDSHQAKSASINFDLKSLPKIVDHSENVTFIRQQGGHGCWANSVAACWDIMNNKISRYTPNVSCNRMIWAWRYELSKSLKIPWGEKCSSWYEYVTKFGCPTEGTELTDGDAARYPLPLGDYEAPNYRLLSPKPTKVKVEMNEIKYHLVERPLRIIVSNGTHYVALVGYNDNTKQFKYLNSAGDRFWDNGFGYIQYDRIKQDIQGADYFDYAYPKSVPSARVHFTSAYRQGVFAWIGVEGKSEKKRIWPSGQRKDNSRNLNLNATLPLNFAWPPSVKNKLYLEIYDAGEKFNSKGGQLIEFSAEFCGDIHLSSKLQNGPISFNAGKKLKITIP